MTGGAARRTGARMDEEDEHSGSEHEVDGDWSVDLSDEKPTELHIQLQRDPTENSGNSKGETKPETPRLSEGFVIDFALVDLAMHDAEDWWTRHLPPAFRMLTNWPAEKFYMQTMNRPNLSTWQRLRVKGYRFLKSPVSSVSAALFTITTLTISLVYLLTFAIEVTNEARALELSYTNGVFNMSVWDETNQGMSWAPFLNVLLGFFGLELVARILCYDRPWTHVTLWVDALCISP